VEAYTYINPLSSISMLYLRKDMADFSQIIFQG